jgi:type IV secretory pathway TrbL component
MKKVLILTSVTELLTGLTLLVYPPILVRLLFGVEIAGAGLFASRIAGISLIALGVACWPDRNMLRPFFGMLTYNLLVTLYLVYVGISGDVGILLWPVVAVHAGLSVLLVWAWRKGQAPEANAQQFRRAA